MSELSLLPQARFELNSRRRESAHPQLFRLLDEVKDPEIPVLSLWELGVLQDVRLSGAPCAGGQPEVQVVVTPTYSGCPALTQMVADIKSVLHAAGWLRVKVDIRLAPAWTTDWLAPATRKVLREYGIAPPGDTRCPQCGSTATRQVSAFGSTACKSLMSCRDCGEPFDYFKPI